MRRVYEEQMKNSDEDEENFRENGESENNASKSESEK